MRPGPRPTFVLSAIMIHPAVWPQQIWAEIWGLCPLESGAGSTSNAMLSAQGLSLYQVVSLSIQPFSHNKHGSKIGSCAPLFGGEGAEHNVAWVEAYRHAKWYTDPCSHLATIDMGKKLGALPPFLGRGAGSSPNAMFLGSRPTSTPSGILIHSAVWVQ